jgi:hypothetical protein
MTHSVLVIVLIWFVVSCFLAASNVNFTINGFWLSAIKKRMGGYDSMNDFLADYRGHLHKCATGGECANNRVFHRLCSKLQWALLSRYKTTGAIIGLWAVSFLCIFLIVPAIQEAWPLREKSNRPA